MADLTRKTANLLDSSILDTPYNITLNGIVNKDTQGLSRIANTTPIDVTNLTSVTLTYNYSTQTAINFIYATLDANDNLVKREAGHTSGDSIDVSTAAKLNICFYISDTPLSVNDISEVMLNSGQTALPYEPYWQHSLRKLTTATEAVENPLYSDGTAITAYTIKGNEEHTGTPSPQNPVMPNGVGNKTANLFDGTVRNAIINDSTGEETSNNSWRCSDFIKVADTKVTLSWVSDNQYYQAKLGYYEAADTETFLSTEVIQGNRYSGTFTIPEHCNYVKISYSVVVSGNPVTREDIMLNTGSTAKPYEPYGYKIPISNGQQTTNIYLGSTQTVRAIKKVVLTGDESFSYDSTNKYYSRTGYGAGVNYLGVCTHYIFSSTNNEGDAYIAPWGAMRIYDSSYSGNVTQFKTWLAAQYANGTPVTFYYVLDTAETAAVNEPLMKIGTYADTISNATAIPTTEGANSITVDTTVQPSEFTATWTGWHNANVKEWDGSQWQ